MIGNSDGKPTALPKIKHIGGSTYQLPDFNADRLEGTENSIRLAEKLISEKVLSAQYISRDKKSLEIQISSTYKSDQTNSSKPELKYEFGGICDVSNSTFVQCKLTYCAPGISQSPSGSICITAKEWLSSARQEDVLTLTFFEENFTSNIENILNPQYGIDQGLFSRMLYFSAVTATTLGYGEIVPLTVRARILVAIESVLGLIVMGSLIFWVTLKP